MALLLSVTILTLFPLITCLDETFTLGNLWPLKRASKQEVPVPRGILLESKKSLIDSSLPLSALPLLKVFEQSVMPSSFVQNDEGKKASSSNLSAKSKWRILDDEGASPKPALISKVVTKMMVKNSDKEVSKSQTEKMSAHSRRDDDDLPVPPPPYEEPANPPGGLASSVGAGGGPSSDDSSLLDFEGDAPGVTRNINVESQNIRPTIRKHSCTLEQTSSSNVDFSEPVISLSFLNMPADLSGKNANFIELQDITQMCSLSPKVQDGVGSLLVRPQFTISVSAPISPSNFVRNIFIGQSTPNDPAETSFMSFRNDTVGATRPVEVSRANVDRSEAESSSPTSESSRNDDEAPESRPERKSNGRDSTPSLNFKSESDLLSSISNAVSVDKFKDSLSFSFGDCASAALKFPRGIGGSLEPVILIIAYPLSSFKSAVEVSRCLGVNSASVDAQFLLFPSSYFFSAKLSDDEKRQRLRDFKATVNIIGNVFAGEASTEGAKQGENFSQEISGSITVGI